MTEERRRLEESRDPRTGWRRWGPYLSERQGSWLKDAFDRYVVHGERGAVNPEATGTKAAAARG